MTLECPTISRPTTYTQTARNMPFTLQLKMCAMKSFVRRLFLFFLSTHLSCHTTLNTVNVCARLPTNRTNEVYSTGMRSNKFMIVLQNRECPQTYCVLHVLHRFVMREHSL